MPKFQCIEKCFVGGMLYSPRPDGAQFYIGEAPPRFQEKRFALVEEQVLVPFRKESTKGVDTDKPLNEYKLKVLGKLEIAALLKKKFNRDFDLNDEAVTRKVLIDAFLEEQAKRTTNQDIAETAKG